jgi:hypothetical protein
MCGMSIQIHPETSNQKGSRSWNNNVGIIDVYYAIIYWLEDFEDTIIAINDVNDIFTRMNNNELINDIVSDFIYGDCYVALRQEVINNN